MRPLNEEERKAVVRLLTGESNPDFLPDVLKDWEEWEQDEGEPEIRKELCKIAPVCETFLIK